MHEGWPENLGPVICVVGARPNFIKMAPLLRAFAANQPAIPSLLVHTGQHYDREMSDTLFQELDLPKADINLGVGSGTHAVQTAEIMRGFEPLIDQHHPSCVLVVGDVNSTLACALVAVKKGVPVIHIEAGLRSGDRSMPEEINRLLTDQLADLLYTTEPCAIDNLKREGIPEERIRFVGNVMIDSLLANRPFARPPEETVHSLHGETARTMISEGYALITLHRPSNVDEPATLAKLLNVFREISDSLPILFVLHPRTRANIDRFGLAKLIDTPRIITLPPQGYLAMLGLTSNAGVVLTDSGGLQEETTVLGIPCLTLRNNTERPITVAAGTNQVVGNEPDAIRQGMADILSGNIKQGSLPVLWDGFAAPRIASDLASWLFSHHSQSAH